MIILKPMAKKIKIRVHKGWFVLFLPALSFKFLRRVCRLGLKFSAKSIKHSSNKSEASWDKHSNIEEVDIVELLNDLNHAFDELAKLEPFVLVEVSEATENVYVKIETV